MIDLTVRDINTPLVLFLMADEAEWQLKAVMFVEASPHFRDGST